jgi:hypothetical protein
MSLSFKGTKSTVVSPMAHGIDNFGPEVQAVTFKYNGVAHTINRRGKSNVKGFHSFRNGTYTITNGTDRVSNMTVNRFDFVSILYTNGRVESNDYTAR